MRTTRSQEVLGSVLPFLTSGLGGPHPGLFACRESEPSVGRWSREGGGKRAAPRCSRSLGGPSSTVYTECGALSSSSSSPRCGGVFSSTAQPPPSQCALLQSCSRTVRSGLARQHAWGTGQGKYYHPTGLRPPVVGTAGPFSPKPGGFGWSQQRHTREILLTPSPLFLLLP